MTSIAVIGSGPMALYALKRLISHSDPLRIILLEASDVPGAGMPYSDVTTSDEMLSNSFSREIPLLTRSFVGWLRAQSPEVLARWKLRPNEADDREFYPRTLLGTYFTAELWALRDKGRAAGHNIEVLTGHVVRDVIPGNTLVRVVGSSDFGAFGIEVERVVIATGHRWPEFPEIEGVPLLSPWPSSRLSTLPPSRIGVVGSSLSAIDVALALGSTHGTFDEIAGGTSWVPNRGSEELHVSFLSPNGVLPEADFHYPYPYEPFAIMTECAVEAELERGTEGLLDRLFALLQRELNAADPSFFDGVGTDRLEDFSDAWFLRRELNGFSAVEASFHDARESMEKHATIPRRYVLLRADSVFDAALERLNSEDYQRFRTHLLPVLADAYATVPHRSLERVLALHSAGALEVRATGDDADYYLRSDGTVAVVIEGEETTFKALIDARGQQPEPLTALPFPTIAEMAPDKRLLAPFRLTLDGEADIYCLAMPQLLERHPFSQGLANCSELATLAVEDLLSRMSTAHVVPSHQDMQATPPWCA